MAKWPLVGRNVFAITDGAQWFKAFGGTRRDATEAIVQQEVRDTYTASNLRVYVSAQSGANSAVTFRVNGGAGTQTVSITGTGEFEDASNTDSLVSGDLICGDFDAVGGMHDDSFSPTTYQVTLDASSNVPPIMGAGDYSAFNSFAPLQGALANRVTEAETEYTMRAARTLRDMRVYCWSYISNKVYVIRKNGADGSLTVTVTGTGEFLDVSNTDSFVAGDEGNYATDGGNANVSVRSVEANTSSGVQMWADLAVGAATEYFRPSGTATTTTEVEAEIEAEAAATIQNLFVNCFTYAETRTIRTRKNQGNGACSVSVSGTGFFEDLSNSDSLAAEDDLAIQQAAGSSGTNGYLIAVEWETSVGPGADELMVARQMGAMQPLFLPPEVVSYSKRILEIPGLRLRRWLPALQN